MANVKNAAFIINFKYTSGKFTIVWLFDHSSCHQAFAEDALNVKSMSLRPSCAKPCM